MKASEGFSEMCYISSQLHFWSNSKSELNNKYKTYWNKKNVLVQSSNFKAKCWQSTILKCNILMTNYGWICLWYQTLIIVISCVDLTKRAQFCSKSLLHSYLLVSFLLIPNLNWWKELPMMSLTWVWHEKQLFWILRHTQRQLLPWTRQCRFTLLTLGSWKDCSRWISLLCLVLQLPGRSVPCATVPVPGVTNSVLSGSSSFPRNYLMETDEQTSWSVFKKFSK